jgi:tetratricopeptide (TPR) repeat protein
MQRKLSLGLLLLFLTLSVTAFAQKKNKKSDLDDNQFESAEFYFANENYLRALPLYKQLVERNPENPYLKYRLGICYLYKIDEKEKSIDLLENAKKGDPELEQIDYWIGRAYHLNYRFDEAKRAFTEYMNTPGISQKEKEEGQRYYNYCENAKNIIRDTAEVEIRNIGPTVNTANSEYVPVITIDESTLMFTYRGVRSTGGLQDPKFRPDTTGEYYEDILVSQKVGDRWLAPEPISNNINTKYHDACIGLSNDGQILFLYKSTTKDNGDIYMSTLNGDVWSAPVMLDENINSKSWEGSCSLSSDGKELYFASERPGGLGGRDIYISKRKPDGTWGPAENLGPTINTKYNDDAPFIHPDGITLMFSSEGHNSIGGYDLFYTSYKSGKWDEPTNLGSPINTPGNERYYVLSADGATGYYSSDRVGGSGQQDLYTVSPGFQGEPPIIALVVGFITLDGNPVDAKINVTNQETGELYGAFKSNGMSGKYLVALRPGNSYKVAIEVEGSDPYYEYVNVKGVDTYVQINKDFNFVSRPGDTTAASGIPTRIQPVVADSNDLLQRKLDAQIQRIKAEQNDQVYEQSIYKTLLKKYGTNVDSTKQYMVEYGTYEDPTAFDSAKVADLGPVQRFVTPEGNVRYSVGPFKTLIDAELFRTRIASRDSTIASNSVVTVLENGKRSIIQQAFRREYKRKSYTPPDDIPVVKSKIGTLETTIGSSYGYDKIQNDYGTFQADGLTYKLELGSVKDSTDFKLGYLAKYGPIEKKIYPDGTIRYQMGPWNTLKEAEDFKAYLIAQDSAAKNSIVTIFYFGQRKTVPEFFNGGNVPCSSTPLDLAFFKGKTLNDPVVYAKFLQVTGNYCADGLIYKVQIGAYRHPENFKYPQLKKFGAAEIIDYPDSITRFTLKQFKTIREAEVFRQECIALGIKDAWITAMYKGERKTLEELIQNDFYGKGIQ